MLLRVGLGRLLLGVMLAATSVCLSACAPSPVTVHTQLQNTQETSNLTLQVTGAPSPMGILSPNKRYAKLLQTRLSNHLIDSGFSLRKNQGDLHIHVVVERITTGGTANRADCELTVVGYDKYPGDLWASKGKVTVPDARKVFEIEVLATKKVRAQGYSKEGLADEAATYAVELVVDYLRNPKTSP